MESLIPNLVPDGDADALAALRDEIERRLEHDSPLVEKLIPQLVASGPGVVAVVFYGSCLTRTAAADSEPDFFLVVESLGRYFAGRPLDRMLGALLPPSIYHPRLVVDGRAIRCKVCVVSAEQLARETSGAARDLYHLGRFSKRVGLSWVRDDAARALVIEARVAATLALAPLAAATLPARFTALDFSRALLGLSYAAERRPPEPGKVESILDADREHALAVAERTLAAVGPLVATDAGDGTYVAGAALATARAALPGLLARSRRRSLARWPKHLVTFDGWLDYAVAKLQRHGSDVALSERARRHPLLLGWPELRRLRREGLLG